MRLETLGFSWRGTLKRGYVCSDIPIRFGNCDRVASKLSTDMLYET
jgi:hypothetical protein